MARGTPLAVRSRLRPVRPRGWWFDGAMLAGFAVITAMLAIPAVREVPPPVRDFVDSYRPQWADLAAQVLNRLGNRGVLAPAALVVALILAVRRRSPWLLAPVVAALLFTGVVVQPLKLIFHRAAPHSPLPDDVEVRLFSQDTGLSYPSGHAVNTIVWYGVLCLLLAPWLTPALRRWIRWTPPIVVGFTATYLGYHWLTDMVAGLFVGILIDRAIARVPWPMLPGSPPAGRDRS